MFGKHLIEVSRGLFGKSGVSGNGQSRGLGRLNRRMTFESLESRQLLSITLPTIADQTVLAGAPLNLALAGSDTAGNAITYTTTVSNSTITGSGGASASLTTTVPTSNPSLKLTVSDPTDGISGTMTFQLFQDLAPNTVDQIMSLVNDGFYNDLTFHRVIENFMIQGGDPNGTGTGGPGYKFDDEFNSALQFTGPGLLAMANSGADTNGSQFFVTVESYRYGDFHYTIFGMITSGSDILNAIESVPTDSSDKPLHTVTITSATILSDTQNGVLRLSAPNGASGAADVTVTATDSVTGETSSQTFHVTVSADTNTERPFLGTISPVQTTANSPVSFYIPATSVDGVAVKYAGTVNPANANLAISVDSATGRVTVTPSNGVSGVFSIEVGVAAQSASSSDSSAWDTQMIPVYVNPLAPSSIQLVVGSDTGGSSSDNLTSLNNTSGKTLQFLVNGVTSGALVQLYSDDALIGQATATGTSVTITTDPTTASLTDGTHSITATQTLKNQTVNVGNLSTTKNLASAPSMYLAVTVDSAGPTFTGTPVVTGVVDVAYTSSLVATDSAGGAITYQLLDPPTGMTIDAATGLISWTPLVSQVGAAPVTVQATDTAGNTTQRQFTVNVLAANTAPTLVAAAPVLGSTDENTPITIVLSGTFINNGSGTTTISDPDEGAVVGGIAVTGVTGNGIWAYSLDGTTFQTITSVSDASALLLPKDATLRYTPDSKNGVAATITYRAWDTTGGAAGERTDLSAAAAVGVHTAYSDTADTAALTVSSVNDAPALTAAHPSLGSTTYITAKTIALGAFINGSGTTTVADIDTGAVVGGIAIVGVTGNGTWSYSLDGTTFTAIGAVSATSALLLPSTASLRYTPDGANVETATIAYAAWDTTTGTDATKVDTTTNGGATAFSATTDTASLSVVGLNVAPVLTAVGPSLGNTTPNTAKTIALVGSFINNGTATTGITDADSGAVIGGIALTGVTGKGTWAYSLDGTTFTAVGTVSATSAILLPKTASLRYTPDGASAETPTITYRAWDTTSGTSGGTADTTTNGDTSAFSTTTDTASLTVAAASISGFVYVDADNDGLRITPAGPTHTGIQGVVVTLLVQGTGGSWTTTSTVMTGADGSYKFDVLAPGTYQVKETQPANFNDGKDTLGTVAGATKGTLGADQFNLTLGASEVGSEYNFGEHGVTPETISLRMFLASAWSATAGQPVVELDHAPVVQIVTPAVTGGYQATYTAGGSPVAVASTTATVADVDSPMLAKMTVTLKDRLDGTSETLAATTTGTSIAATYADGVLTLSGVASAADYQKVLKTVTYADTATSPKIGVRTIEIVVNDGILDSEPATGFVTVKSAVV